MVRPSAPHLTNGPQARQQPRVNVMAFLRGRNKCPMPPRSWTRGGNRTASGGEVQEMSEARRGRGARTVGDAGAVWRGAAVRGWVGGRSRDGSTVTVTV